MKRLSSQAFTLIEMLTVMLIISIVTGLIVGVATFANKKAASSRTQGEIEAISTAINSYKADNGTVPRGPLTEQASGGMSPIDPRNDGYSGNKIQAYQAASLFLYEQLSGDADQDGAPGDNSAHVYYEFKPAMLAGYNAALVGQKTAIIKYLQDSYGLSFGYSTAGAKAEDDYREKARTDTSGQPPARDATQHGFNTTFDLWSTAGVTTDPPTDAVRQRWVKNW